MKTRSELFQDIDSIDPRTYDDTRNDLDGAVTQLSKYITHGVITLPEIHERLLQRLGSEKAFEPFLFQLMWREHFHHSWKVYGEGIFSAIQNPQEGVRAKGIPSAILNAQTGIEVIDEGIRTLYETGYIHNHMRMWITSIVCNVAKCNWLRGARWMFYHLIDGDLASNMLSWQWVAGTFSKRQYFANQDNLNRFSKTSQQGTFLDLSYEELIKQDVPEILQATEEPSLEETLPETTPATLNPQLPTLLFHPWNLNPDWHGELEANRILVIDPQWFADYPISALRREWIDQLASAIPNLQKVAPSILHELPENQAIHWMEYPLIKDWPGHADPFPKIFPEAEGEYRSFFKFWNAYQKWRKQQQAE